jgi:hypothetical protein
MRCRARKAILSSAFRPQAEGHVERIVTKFAVEGFD